MRSRNVADEIVCHPTTFVVGAHTLVLTPLPSAANTWSRWTLTVDGTQADRTFETEVDAWSEGVRAADELDRAAAAAR